VKRATPITQACTVSGLHLAMCAPCVPICQARLSKSRVTVFTPSFLCGFGIAGMSAYLSSPFRRGLFLHADEIRATPPQRIVNAGCVAWLLCGIIIYDPARVLMMTFIDYVWDGHVQAPRWITYYIVFPEDPAGRGVANTTRDPAAEQPECYPPYPAGAPPAILNSRFVTSIQSLHFAPPR